MSSAVALASLKHANPVTSALENLETEEAESPEVSRDRSKSPLPEAKADEA